MSEIKLDKRAELCSVRDVVRPGKIVKIDCKFGLRSREGKARQYIVVKLISTVTSDTGTAICAAGANTIAPRLCLRRNVCDLSPDDIHIFDSCSTELVDFNFCDVYPPINLLS